MSEKHVISFTMVADFFKNNIKQLQRGENSYKSGNVQNMTFDSELRPAVLRGKVKASMKRIVYSVEVSLDVDGQAILDVKCTCPRGQVVCHHIAALCLHAHHNISITDKACVWSAKTTSEKESVQTIKDLYPSLHSDYVAIQNTVSEADVESFRSKLGSGNVVGFSWLLQPHCEEDVEAILPSIENLIFSTEYLKTPNKKEYIIDKCRITESQVQLVIENTIGQANNENWLIARKNRITASNFGSILAAVKRNRFPPSLYKRLTDGYDLSSVLAVQWGKEHEKVAVETFISGIEGAEVIPTGLWLDTCGFLGASPDGLCGDSCIVEVKCPYKFRNCSLSEALKNDKTYIIY